MELAWITEAREKALKDLKSYFGFQETDIVVFGGFFYSMNSYLLSKKSHEKLTKKIVEMSLLLSAFGGIHLIFLVDALGPFWAEVVVSSGLFFIFLLYGLTLNNTLNKGKKVRLTEQPAPIYAKFLARYCRKKNLSSFVNQAKVLIAVLSIGILAMLLKGHFAISVLMICLLALGWALLRILDKANKLCVDIS
ncbi:hypothetical protein KIH87_12700 [Paraneptunicella aestuarii]|uniref:hypothetical protein n=1 Tax=Paraneptunicella aestuarii TaxID=2831148 RepID=UPI001E3B98B5|nr:hypothetical protein [Paraneptunicella aestuarii]UAA37568.1 hypothetical protein KIH87_12700 [Paraneptunicella aestuarii]